MKKTIGKKPEEEKKTAAEIAEVNPNPNPNPSPNPSPNPNP